MTILGLSLSHDSSAAITTNKGEVIAAISEERISRKKNHTGLPIEAIKSILDESQNSTHNLPINSKTQEEISKVIIGSHNNLDHATILRFLADLEENPSNPKGLALNPFPGFTHSKFGRVTNNPKALIEDLLKSLFSQLRTSEFIWTNHHDSHLGCALGAASEKLTKKPNTKPNEPILLVSLDGEGDGESGAISVLQDNSLKSLIRIKDIDSLGMLYSAVTERYNFKGGRHEGKITGLAAFGENSQATEILSSFIEIIEGNIRIKNTKDIKKILLGRSLRALGIRTKTGLRLSEIVDMAEATTTKYEDLAFAVQEVLENTVKELIIFWIKKTGVREIGLAGGVFSNVKLNQKIAALEDTKNVFVFPNMGDGGISLGGVWSHLFNINQLAKKPLYESMYIAPKAVGDQDLLQDIKKSGRFSIEEPIDINKQAQAIAKLLAGGFCVALHHGRMEFGPRALGNRSLLIDPRDRSINARINSRLKRTEFMPFAPVVRESDFFTFFDIPESQTLLPFRYMTMTCEVKKEAQKKIPAAVHIDGTARPQVLFKDDNPFLEEIIEEFSKISYVPVLVNTSLNVHEEPINFSLENSIDALNRNAFDFLVYDGNIISRC